MYYKKLFGVFLGVLCLIGSGLAIPDPTAAATTCTSSTYPDAQTAKNNFGNDCGGNFQNTPDYRCDWVPGGWQCTGPGTVSSQADPPSPQRPADSQSTEERLRPPPSFPPIDHGDHIELRWRTWQGTDGVNVYRDSVYIATVSGSQWRYRDYDGDADSKYQLVSFRGGEYSSMSPPLSSTPVSLTERIRIIGLGDTGRGYVSLIWIRPPGIDGMNVYRNGDYVATVRSGTVYNDYAGRVGDEYELVSFKGDQYSKPSSSAVVGERLQLSASAVLQPDSAQVTIRWEGDTSDLHNVFVYRKNAGGMVRPGEGELLGHVPAGGGQFIDRSPVRGASYGLMVVQNDGARRPIATAQPDYGQPLILLQPRCSMLSGSCDKPFTTLDTTPGSDSDTSPGSNFDRIEVIPVDPTLDTDNGALINPHTSRDFWEMLDSSFARGADEGLTEPVDDPLAVVPLNAVTDPDGDGLSILTDDDNDNDGVKRWEDQNDLDPSIGRRPTPPSPDDGGGGGGGNPPGTPTPTPTWETMLCRANTDKSSQLVDGLPSPQIVTLPPTFSPRCI